MVKNVEIIKTANQSTFNDTVLGWALAHDASIIEKAKSGGKFRPADLWETKYALSLAGEFFPESKGKNFSVLLYESEKITNVYWLSEPDNFHSIVIFLIY